MFYSTNRKLSSVLIIALLLLVGATSVVEAKKPATPTGKKLIKNIQSAFKDLDSFSCKFRLEFTWALAHETDVTEGVMQMAKKDKFRYETASQVMVTDGETLWRFNHLTQQAIVENLEDSEPGILPREMLFDYPKKFEPGEVRETSLNGRLTYILDLLPKESDMGIQSITVWVDAIDSITRKMEFTDESGNNTIYQLTEIAINPGIENDHFVFNAPDGITVYDLR